MNNLTDDEKIKDFISSYRFLPETVQERTVTILERVLKEVILHGIGYSWNTLETKYEYYNGHDVTVFYYDEGKDNFWNNAISLQTLKFFRKNSILSSKIFNWSDIDLGVNLSGFEFLENYDDVVGFSDYLSSQKNYFPIKDQYKIIIIHLYDFQLVKKLFTSLEKGQYEQNQRTIFEDKYSDGPFFDEETSVLTYKNGLSHSFTETDERYEPDSPRIRSPLFKLLWKNREIQRNGISDSEKAFISYQKIAEVCSLSWESSKKADTSRTIRETVGKVNKILQKKGFPLDMKCKKGAKIIITL